MDTLLEILKLGAVGLFAGLFSSHISIRKHRNEKWWELRVDAYKAVLEALSDLNYYYEKHYKVMIQNRTMSDEYQADLRKFWESGFHKVRKLADSGVFLFSDEVNSVLNEFIALKNREYEDYFLDIDDYYEVTQKCLKIIVASSKHDLKVKDTWL